MNKENGLRMDALKKAIMHIILISKQPCKTGLPTFSTTATNVAVMVE